MIKAYLSINNLSNYKKDILYTVLFGFLSIVFASIKFYIPGYEGIVSNFREVPLLISILYIRNPLYLIVLSLLTTLYTATGIPYSLNFTIHLTSLLGGWVLYYYVNKYVRSIVPKTISWVLITIIYFTLLLIPIYIIGSYLISHSNELNFVESYLSVFDSLAIEVITTILVTTLFLMQFEIRSALISHKENLESVVDNRTAELALANKTLTHLNENLDDLVKHRSMTIEKQLNMLVKYAHMNSHEVRAPLARMLGLLYIIDQEDRGDDRIRLHNQLKEASQELDEVVKRMNRLLEKEIFINIE